MQMILALGILILMVALIVTRALPFGAPPLLACILIVLCGLGDVSYAFSGFASATTWMFAFFLAVTAAFTKTSVMARFSQLLERLISRGGHTAYLLLLLVITLGASLVGMGATGYYVLVLTVLSALPAHKSLPGTRLLLPLGMATNHPLLPINVALQYGVTVSLLESAGAALPVSMLRYAGVMLCVTLAYLAWAAIAYPLLPARAIPAPTQNKTAPEAARASSTLSSHQERLTILLFAISIIALMLSGSLGQRAYMIPDLAVFLLMITGVLTFQEICHELFSPIILLMAGVISVTHVLADTGLTALVGQALTDYLGDGLPYWVIILIFSVLTSAFASIIGSQTGSIYVFAPFAIAFSTALGYNPTAVTVAITISGWCGNLLPVDGLTALSFGLGGYTLRELWTFTLPLYIIRLLTLTAAVLVVFGA